MAPNSIILLGFLFLLLYMSMAAPRVLGACAFNIVPAFYELIRYNQICVKGYESLHSRTASYIAITLRGGTSD